MSAHYLLTRTGGSWEAFRLDEIRQDTAVVWNDHLTQLDVSTEPQLKVEVEALDDCALPNLAEGDSCVVAGELDDGFLLVEEALGASLIFPFVVDRQDRLDVTSTRKGGASLSLSKTRRDEGAAAGLQSPHARSRHLALTGFEARSVLVWWTGYPAWLTERRTSQRRDHHDSGKAFINPYTFVPLPEKVSRTAPRGHAGRGDGLIGSVNLTYELLTDLVLPTDWPHGDGSQRVALPGSATRGAVRSLHEVIAGGCMRVVDLDARPIHRETTAQANVEHLLAVVDDVSNARVTRIRLAEKPIWVPASKIKSQDIRSGLRFEVTPTPVGTIKLGRPVFDGDVTLKADPNGAWVMHLSDTGARQKEYWVPLARLTSNFVDIPPQVSEVFEQACLRAGDGNRNGDDDGGKATLASDALPITEPHQAIDVRVNRRYIGKRRKVDGRLGKGDSVWWVPTEKRLKMAVIWRQAGEHAVNERMSPVSTQPCVSTHPCEDPGNLCPTCSIFGSAGPTADGGREDGVHRAYGSHVRFLPAISAKVVCVRQVQLAPLREPRPGSGGFYLLNPETPGALRGQRGFPASHWGSALDHPEPRRIAGRKFYWHGQVTKAPPNRQPRQFQRNPKIEDAPRLLVPAGTTFHQEVTFDGLDERQLAQLLCALNPQELSRLPGATRPEGELALHWGGGKPLGFGTVRCTGVSLTAHRAAERYASSSSGLPADVQLGSPLAVTAGINPQAPWFTSLLHALDTAFVDADRIHYPFDPEEASFTSGPTAAFLESFRFFAQYDGGQVRTDTTNKKRYVYPLVPLPAASDDLQYIAPKPDVERLP